MTTMFQKATRKKVKLKIAVTGPSGSGKTMSSLYMASGIGKKIALIDTENDSASLYSDDFEFDTISIKEPYTVRKYVEAINAAEKEGYDVLVIDSLTHAWAGEGGLLSKKEALDAAGKGNSYTNWASITKEHEAFKAKILNANLHMICTMRSKQDYMMVENEKGKQAPKKVGMAPIQRDGMEYEFTTVFDISMSHEAHISKDRTGLFGDDIHKITKKTGEKFIKWLGSAIDTPLSPPKVDASPVPAQAPKSVQRTEPAQYPHEKPLPTAHIGEDTVEGYDPDENFFGEKSETHDPLPQEKKYPGTGNKVLPGGIFSGRKIGEIWEASPMAARSYSLNIEKEISSGKRPNPIQIEFVEYGNKLNRTEA